MKTLLPFLSIIYVYKNWICMWLVTYGLQKFIYCGLQMSYLIV